MESTTFSLEAAIDKRDYDSLRFTKRIFDMIRVPLTEATRRIISMERDIEWISIEKTLGINSYVNIQGRVVLKEGDTVSVKGKPLVITAENIDKYFNTISLTSSVVILESMNVDAIYEHIQFVMDAIKNNTFEVLLEILEKNIYHAALLADPEHEKLLEKVTRPRYVGGFDTRPLSPEQTELLQLTINSESEQKHKMN